MLLLRRATVLVVLTVLAVHPLVGDEALDREVEQAIDRGTEFLLRAVRGMAKGPDNKAVGTWKAVEGYPMGSAAIQVYALVKSDIPYSHPTVREGLEILARMPLSNGKTYSMSLYVMALDAVLSQMEVDMALGGLSNAKMRRTIQDRLEAASQWLVRARWKGRGAWNYGIHNPNNPRYDHSNTQFALLALGVAHKRRVKIPVEVWQEIVTHFIETQQPSGPEVKPRWQLKESEDESVTPRKHGKTRAHTRLEKPTWGKEAVRVFARGWAYTEPKKGEKRNPSFNMTCAGASSTLIAYNALRYRRGFEGETREKLEKSVRDGLGWLIHHVNGKQDWSWGGLGGAYYSLYSLEKVGDIGGIEKFGDFDWYDTGARHLLGLQNKKLGCWGTTDKPGNLNYMTSLALLFLSRATDLTFHNRPLVRHMTGRGSSVRQKGSSRDWVYLPRMKVEVPARRIFRKLRYLPTQKLLRMAEGVIKYYDTEHKPELIPTLIQTYARSPYPTVKKAMRRGLESITGFKTKNIKGYQDFITQWKEVIKAGRERDAAKVPKLLSYLRQTESPVLRLKVIWALGLTRARTALGDLIELMGSGNLQTRRQAYGAVAFISRKNFPFDPSAPASTRQKQLAVWQAWFNKEGRS